MDEKLISIKDGEDIFNDLSDFKKLENLLITFTETE